MSGSGVTTQNGFAEAKSGRPSFPGVGAVQHAITILQAMDAREPELGVNEVARRIGVHKSTASRILATLERAQFVRRNPETGRFSIGLGLIALVSPIVADLDVVKLARPYIDRLAREQGETTSLGFLLDREVIMVEQVPGSRAVAFLARAGARVPAHCTAAGKVFLAHLKPEERRAFFAEPLQRFTTHTKVTEAELEEELRLVRETGYATNDEEYQHESCGIASMIWDSSGAPVAALTMAIPKHRFDAAYRRELAELVVQHAGELSRSLGHIPRPGMR
jgi:DNA-binding IclR family transcriptional regulator